MNQLVPIATSNRLPPLIAAAGIATHGAQPLGKMRRCLDYLAHRQAALAQEHGAQISRVANLAILAS